MLERVLSREGAELSARGTITKVLTDSESLATLVPQYEHARGLLATATDRYAIVARTALGDQRAEQLLADPAWPALADVLAIAESRQLDPGRVLRQAHAERDFTDAESVAQVLHWRVHR
ncbi:MAG: hypothetical protein M3P91_05705 [Actinomycetota bacterium]|nr:hypothetical protein [Actinomycetota bacterium]